MRDLPNMCRLDGDHIWRNGTYSVQRQLVVWFFRRHDGRDTRCLLPFAQPELVGGDLGKRGPGTEALWGGGGGWLG